jgi:catechol 2,3-dioxygenase-like lactoylglutathione lyase family enzyme
MIDHLELQTRNMIATLRFFSDVLAPLGYEQKLDGASRGFGAADSLDFFLVDGEPSANVHFAFQADSREAVDQACEAGRTNGHAIDRAPAIMPHIHPNYYAGFLRDPDGRLVEIVCHLPNTA